MAISSRWSLLLSEESTIREPSLTTSPPNRLGSTLSSTVTFCPTALRSCSPRLSCCAGVSLRRHHFGRHLAAPRGERAKKALDHLGQREEAAVTGQEAEKIAGQRLQPGALGQGGDRLALRGAGNDRAADHAAQIGALGHDRFEAAQVGRDRVERLRLVGEFEEGNRIALGKPSCACRFRCHV